MCEFNSRNVDDSELRLRVWQPKPVKRDRQPIAFRSGRVSCCGVAGKRADSLTRAVATFRVPKGGPGAPGPKLPQITMILVVNRPSLFGHPFEHVRPRAMQRASNRAGARHHVARFGAAWRSHSAS